MKAGKLLFVLLLVAGAAYAYSMLSKTDDAGEPAASTPDEGSKGRRGVGVEEKFGFTGEQALP